MSQLFTYQKCTIKKQRKTKEPEKKSQSFEYSTYIN